MPGDDYYFDLPPAEYAAELQKPSFFEVNKTKCIIALVVVVGVVFGVIICQAINGSAFSNTKKVPPPASSVPVAAAPVAATPVESFTPKKNKSRRNKNNKKRKHESAVNIIRHEENEEFMGKRKKKRSKK